MTSDPVLPIPTKIWVRLGCYVRCGILRRFSYAGGTFEKQFGSVLAKASCRQHPTMHLAHNRSFHSLMLPSHHWEQLIPWNMRGGSRIPPIYETARPTSAQT